MKDKELLIFAYQNFPAIKEYAKKYYSAGIKYPIFMNILRSKYNQYKPILKKLEDYQPPLLDELEQNQPNLAFEDGTPVKPKPKPKRKPRAKF